MTLSKEFRFFVYDLLTMMCVRSGEGIYSWEAERRRVHQVTGEPEWDVDQRDREATCESARIWRYSQWDRSAWTGPRASAADTGTQRWWCYERYAVLPVCWFFSDNDDGKYSNNNNNNKTTVKCTVKSLNTTERKVPAVTASCGWTTKKCKKWPLRWCSKL